VAYRDVDLMKALDIDPAAARKDLAKELGYTGDSNDPPV
jgi:hypothetical protein